MPAQTPNTTRTPTAHAFEPETFTTSRLLDFFSEKFPDMVAMGALTIIANIYGNPAVSIPVGTVDDLPVGMQVLGRHHTDGQLLDVALSVERERPWPKVAPAVARAVSAPA